MKKISIIIPVYNEQHYLPNFIPDLMQCVKKNPEISQVIFVNDGSTDQTRQILDKAQKKYPNTASITSSLNRGKGYSMRLGFNRAQKDRVDGVIFMDGDGQHDPIHIKEFIAQLKHYPIVFGYRELKQNTPFIRKLGNKISSFIIQHIFRINRVGDILCGYFAVRKDVFAEINWNSNDYGVEAEVSAIIGRKMIPFKEIQVKTIYLNEHKGVNIWHALRILLRIPYWNIIYSYE